MANESQASGPQAYAMGQFLRAVDSAIAASDPADRARLQAKAERWRQTLAGMADGSVTVGSRTPVRDTPAWVTLDVLHGGFATGSFAADRPLTLAERAVVRRHAAGISAVEVKNDRERLNLWYLTDAGRERLQAEIAARKVRAEVPEDTALPVLSWLLRNGHAEAALDLASELRPWLARLRLAPPMTVTAPAPAPAAPSATDASTGTSPRAADPLVNISTAGETAQTLANREPQRQVAVMTETLLVWNPLFDRLVTLWCETVEGDLPVLTQHQRDAGAAPVGPGSGPGAADGLAVTGGWPCRRWPTDWSARRIAWLADYQAAAAEHPLSRRHLSPKGNFARLLDALRRCESGSAALTGRDVGWIRRALANTVTRQGAPGSPERTALRAVQAQVAAQPRHADLARILSARLGQFPAGEGIPSLDPIEGGVRPEETVTSAGPLTPGNQEIPAGYPIPAYLTAKAARALRAPVTELIERGIISSAEILADILPQLTRQALSAGITDPGLRALHEETYEAFRRRRSLLLLNLEHQVRFEELPWIAALEPLRAPDATPRSAARDVLGQVTLMALTGFPQTILPNPLVAEMTALARQSGLAIPLTEEIAADIFAGAFTWKWRRAAAIASRALAGTLYARYYDLPAADTWDSAPDETSSAGTPPAEALATEPGAQPKRDEEFFARCVSRSAEARTADNWRGSFVAVNGTVLEQAQILTTHNLAVLAETLGIQDRLARLAPGLADRAFDGTLRFLRQETASGYPGLTAVKNAAYAWRQAIYFLSLCDTSPQAETLDRLQERVSEDGRLAHRAGPAVAGLAHVINGGRFDADGTAPDTSSTASSTASGTIGPRRFLGWTAGPHWTRRAPEPAISD